MKIDDLFRTFESMKKYLLWFLCALMMTACSSCSAGHGQAGDDQAFKADSLVVGDRLPDFEGSMNDGSVVHTADLLGQPSVVVLFSVYCTDCRHELPEIQRLWDMSRQGELTGDGKALPIVLISRENTVEDITPFWEFGEYTMPYSPQPDRRIYSLFAPSRIPRIYISDPAGIIRFAHADDKLPSAESLTREVLSANE